MSAPVFSRSRVIAAPPERIFDILADPSKHALIDGSGTVKAARGEPQRLSLGARFSMDMRIGAPYRTTNTVSEFEENRRIAWHHFFGHTWRYELEPVEGGTKVTETFDASTAKFPPALKLMGVERKHPHAMEATLQRLSEVVAAGTPRA